MRFMALQERSHFVCTSAYMTRSVHQSRDLYIALLDPHLLSVDHASRAITETIFFSLTAVSFCKLSEFLSYDTADHCCGFVTYKSLFVSLPAYLSYCPIFSRICFPSSLFLKRVTRCLPLRWKHHLIQGNGKNRK